MSGLCWRGARCVAPRRRNSYPVTAITSVIGDQDVRRFKGEEKSTKHRKAEALICGGASLKIISEADFEQLVSFD